MREDVEEYTSKVYSDAYPGSDIQVWDSLHFSPQTTFSIYREEVCVQEGFVWSPKSGKDEKFRVRNEFRRLEGGVVYRCRHAGVELERGRREISRSSAGGHLVTFCVSGSLTVLQTEEARVVRPGDLAIFDLSYPLKVAAEKRETIGFYVPEGSRPVFERHAGDFRHSVIPSHLMSTRLRSCLNFLSDQSRGAAEISAVMEAVVSVLPIDAGCYETRAAGAGDTPLYADIMSYMETRLGDHSLSARSVAAAFGVSERHVHRLFARRGLRLGAVLQRLRLDGAAGELIRQRDRQITEAAFRWGFNDLSTFTRAFKKRYGRSPSKFRALG